MQENHRESEVQLLKFSDNLKYDYCYSSNLPIFTQSSRKLGSQGNR